MPIAARDLIDREEEAQRLLSRAYEGRNSRLSAPRRYGKTSLLNKVIEDARGQGFQAVYVNFFGVLAIEDLVSRIEQAYQQDLQGPLQRWVIGVTQHLNSTFSVPGVSVAVGSKKQQDVTKALYSLLDLPTRILKKTGQRTVVVFDEFQDVLAATPSADGLIRSRIELHRDQASYIFAGSHVGLMTELFSKRERPFYNQAGPVELHPLRDEDIAEYVAARFHAHGREIGGIMGQFLALVRGHPQRAMLLAYYLFDATTRGATAEEAEWQKAINNTYREVKDTLNTAWLGMNENDRRVLTVIAQNPTHLDQRLLSKYGIARTTARDIRHRLATTGEVMINEDSTLIVDPLLEAWLIHGRQGLTAAQV